MSDKLKVVIASEAKQSFKEQQIATPPLADRNDGIQKSRLSIKVKTI